MSYIVSLCLPYHVDVSENIFYEPGFMGIFLEDKTTTIQNSVNTGVVVVPCTQIDEFHHSGVIWSTNDWLMSISAIKTWRKLCVHGRCLHFFFTLLLTKSISYLLSLLFILSKIVLHNNSMIKPAWFTITDLIPIVDSYPGRETKSIRFIAEKWTRKYILLKSCTQSIHKTCIIA